MINFKKVASILASGVMLASTISFAAAANLYPKPFTDGAAIVYGTNAASTDMAGAIDIYDQLKARTSTSTDASVAGEAKAVETSSQPLYLGENMNDTKATFTKDQLPLVLADDVITDDDGKEFDVVLKLDVPDSKVIYGDGPDNAVEPFVYLDTNANTHNYAFKIVFPKAVNTTKLTDEAIRLFGKDYVFSGSVSNLVIDTTTMDNTKVVLFEKAVPVIVNDGESVTSEGHTISVAVEDSNTAAITIDGVTESKDEGWSGKINSVDIYVKNVVGPNVAGTSRYCELYLNSNKLTLQSNAEVTLGTEDIDGTNVTFTISSDKVSEIKIDVIPYDFDEDIKYLKLGDSFIDPTFGNVKFELASVTPELEATTRDEIVIKPTGEKKVGIKFTNKAGKVYDLNILKDSVIGMNSSYHYEGPGSSTAPAYNATELGVDDYDLIIFPNSTSRVIDGVNVSKELIVNESDYFITCSNDYTQIWRLKNIKLSTPALTIEDQGSGSSAVDVSLSASTDGATGTLTLADGSSTTLMLTGTLGITSDKACGYLYTKQGAKIRIDGAGWNGTARHDGVKNYTCREPLSQIIIEEETDYNGGSFTDAAAANIGRNITLQFRYNMATRSGNDMELVSTTPSGTLDMTYWTDDVGDYDNYYVTQYGTFIKETGNNDNTDTLYYPEDAMKVGFYIGEVSSEITPGTTGSAGGQIAIIKDSEVSTAASKNLIVVGGSCVNTVAAKILGSDAPLCGEDFSTATKVGAGGYIIKTVDAATAGGSAGKVAMLVAGYNAADTTNAVKRAMVIDGVKTDAGSEEIFPVVA